MNKKDFIDRTLITNNSKGTKELGRNFARVLKKGDIVCLYGDLGSGKTTFIQGLAEGLGIKQRIISPTFIIIRSYKLGVRSFYHIDLYRVESERGLEGLGIKEIINNKNNIIVIEWAQNLKNFLPKKRIDVKFSYTGKNKRKIIFNLGL